MTICNGASLLLAAPITSMVQEKTSYKGTSFGLSEVGYDVRVKQEIKYTPPDPERFALWIKRPPDTFGRKKMLGALLHGYTTVTGPDGIEQQKIGRTALASSIEKFEIPETLWCELRNKSTLARRFIDASLGTDAEPGWVGFLTLEIVFHGMIEEIIPAGTGLLKAVFHELKHPAQYDGKYQNQPDHPVKAIMEKTNG